VIKSAIALATAAHLVPAPALLRPGFASLLHSPPVEGGRSADRRLFVIVVAPASASVGRAGDARVASCEAAPDALAFRRSTVAVARHASLRIRDRLENTPSKSEAANVLLQMQYVVKF
jgi:hypothetical protein